MEAIMRILYFSDKYTSNVMGVKRSIFEETKRKGMVVIFQDKKEIARVLALVKTHNPDQIWLAHSGLVLQPEVKLKIRIPVVGFGFSDPYYFSEERLKSYDAYITNYYKIYLCLKTKFEIPIFYSPPSCDFRFHRKLEVKKDIDISCIGLGKHPRFKNKAERIGIINKLREETKFNIHAYGRKWPPHSKNFNHIEGAKFLDVIHRSRIGLDIQDAYSPISHRIFEYSACGTPIITREKEEIYRVFEKDKEVLTYNNYSDLKEKLIYYLGNTEKLNRIGLNAQKRCEREHDVKYRMEKIFNFLNKLGEP